MPSNWKISTNDLFDHDVQGSGEYIYLIEANIGDLYKIGKTSDPERRMRELRPRRVLALAEAINATSVEKALHSVFAHARLAGTEYFSLTEEEIEEIIDTIESDSGFTDPKDRLIPATPKEGIEFAIEYQKRHSACIELIHKKAFHEACKDLNPTKMAELELRTYEAFDRLDEYIDICSAFRGYAYDGPIEGVLKAMELICAYHAYRIEQGEDEECEDLEPRRWRDDLLRVSEWKKAGMTPIEMMNRSHDNDSKRSQRVIDEARKSIDDTQKFIEQSSGNPNDRLGASSHASPRHESTFKPDESQSENSVLSRRAKALERWRLKKYSDDSNS